MSAQTLLSSAMNGSGPSSVAPNSQRIPFGISQNSSMVSSLNGSTNGSTENATSGSPPDSSPPAYANAQSSSSGMSGAQAQATASNVLPHSMSASSFFPSGSFPFSVPSQYASQGSVINSTSNPSASTNSISSAVPSIKPSSISGPSSQSNGMSNFFPNSVSPIMEDTSSINANGFTALRISNLPRDVQEREFNVLFTFAQDFVYSELLKSHSVSEDGLPSSVVGIGYFKSMPAASNAMAVLTRNPHVFAPKDIFSHPNVSASPYAIKCDLRVPRQDPSMRIPGFNLNGTTSPSNGLAQQPQSQPQSSPVSLLPQQGQPFKGASSKFVFPGGAVTNLPLEMPPNFQDMYSEGGVFSPTSPRSMFPVENEYLPRMSGKSLLLESQSKEDEEYSDMVKDPIGWYARPNGYSNAPNHPGYPPMNGLPASASTVQPPQQAQQAPPQSNTSAPKSQQASRGHSPPTPSNASTASTSSQPQTFKTTAVRANSSPMPLNQPASNATSTVGSDAWNEKRRASTTRSFQNLSLSSTQSKTGAGVASPEGKPVVVPYSPTNGNTNVQVLQSGGRVLPPVNPADQNPPCNTLYVGNLPPDTNEEELKDLFSSRRGYKRLCFRTKANGPMCFVEFEDVNWATRALEELYGFGLSNSVKGGIRLSFSKNPLGVRSQAGGSSSNNGNGASNNHHSRIGSQQMAGNGVSSYNNGSRTAGYSSTSNSNSNTTSAAANGNGTSTPSSTAAQQQVTNYAEGSGYMINK